MKIKDFRMGIGRAIDTLSTLTQKRVKTGNRCKGKRVIGISKACKGEKHSHCFSNYCQCKCHRGLNLK